MLVLCISWELMVWYHRINENRVSVNVTVVALFNMYVYTRTHNYPFLIQNTFKNKD